MENESNSQLSIFHSQFLCPLNIFHYPVSMTTLSQAKDMFRLQKEAKRIKKQLKKIQVEAEAGGIKVVVSAEQEVLEITIADDVAREKIPGLLTDALNRAMKKAQVVSAEYMQSVMGEMGMPTEAGMRGLSQ